MKIWIDGSGHNGTYSRFAVAREDGEFTIKKFNQGTSNEMEYKALIEALKIAKDGDEILTDSKLVVGQLLEGWKVKANNLYPLWSMARELLKEKKVELKWIPRKENRAGHLLE